MNGKLDFKLLNDEVKDSTDKNRQFFFAYVFLLTYILVVVLSTTDKMLLRSVDGIKLPFIELTLPLIGFYWVIPLFVLGLHFNLLHNLNSHHFKLLQWRVAFPGKEVPRSLIHAFLFDFATLDSHGSLAKLVRWTSVVLCFYFGPITLAAVLWKMAKYQSVPITVWHMAAFTFNLYLVSAARKALLKNESAEREPFEHATVVVPTMLTGRAPEATEDGSRNSQASKPQRVSGVARTLRNSAKLLFALVVLAEGGLSIAMSALPSDAYLYCFQWVPTGYRSSQLMHFANLFVPRLFVNRNEVVFEIDEAEQKTVAASQHQSDWAKWFIRYGNGMDLSGRSLRAAQLPGQNLPRAFFGLSHLEDATFADSNLEGADFSQTQMQRMNLSDAVLDEAAFQGADLREADARGASMRGTSIQNSDLRGADFELAHGPGLIIAGGRAEGIKLSRAHLEGARIVGIDLTGAYADKVHLEGASVSKLRAWGMVLWQSHLQGARLNGVDFQGALFLGSNMAGADFDGSQLQGTSSFNSNWPLLGVEGLTPASLSPTAWQNLLDVASEVPTSARGDYKQRVKLAETFHPLSAKNFPKIDPDESVKLWLSDACQFSADPLEDDNLAMQTVRIKRMLSKVMQDDTQESTLALLSRFRTQKVGEQFKQGICAAKECLALRNTLKAEHRFDCEAPETFPRFDSLE